MFLKKNIDVDFFDNVLQNAKHRAYDASNDVNRPPLSTMAVVTLKMISLRDISGNPGVSSEES